MPLGNGATFDPTQYLTASHGVVPWINAEDYSIPVYRASASDPLVTINAVSGTNIGPVTVRIPANAQPAAGTDKHLVVISPDGLSSDEWEGLDLSTRTAYVYIHVDLEGSGVGIGWARATGVSELGGLIRKEEVAGGVIPHAPRLASLAASSVRTARSGLRSPAMVAAKVRSSRYLPALRSPLASVRSVRRSSMHSSITAATTSTRPEAAQRSSTPNPQLTGTL